MRAIQTYRLAQTEKSPSRIKAQSEAKSRIYPWDYNLNTEENHVYAAEKLAQELGWWEGLVWVAGGLKDGSYAHVALTTNHALQYAYDQLNPRTAR